MYKINSVKFIEKKLGKNICELKNYPEYINIETINTCNARCIMCGINFDSGKKLLMSKDIFNKIVSELKKNINQIKKINLYLDGEPLIDRYIHHKIEILKKIGIKNVNISSNCSALNKKRSYELIDSGLDEIYITFDSMYKERYERIKKGLNFERVYKNILNFIEIRNSLNSNTIIRIQLILQEINKNEKNDFLQHWKNILRENDKIVIHKAHNWGKKIKTIEYEEDKIINNIPCTILWSNFCIHSNGDVALCTMNTTKNRENIIGSIKKNSIKEIWNGQKINFVRELHLNNNRGKHNLCDLCTGWRETKNIIEYQI